MHLEHRNEYSQKLKQDKERLKDIVEDGRKNVLVEKRQRVEQIKKERQKALLKVE